MKKVLISLLVFINIFVLIGLTGLVFYQFSQIVDRNTEISRLNDQILASKNTKSTSSTTSISSASTQASLQIKAEDQSSLLDNKAKNATGKYLIKVYFSKNPDSNADFSKVFSVDRETDRKDVVNFAISELIKGPSSSESAQGYISPLKLTGVSNCGVNDFSISINQNKVTLQFCKPVITAGVGDDARIKSTIEATLKQFTTIEKVIILNNNNTCFGDLSGQNTCKD